MKTKKQPYLLKNLVKGPAAIFIDAANIFYSQQTLGWRVDYKKLKSYIRSQVSTSEFFYYTGKVGILEKQEHKRVIVFSTRGHVSKELLQRAKYVDLRKLKKEIILKKSGARKSS
ncbi:hypothetical protein A3I56_01820 [Candidatus Roizmanbacteria bacterium RIFCSPLOWO2_02_FULL_43_10]|uniref:Uncharacterized protein n=2 Tax=Candidatus Roizmaniibacteriota TaxID=1752723 RepID=A0A1F7K0E1_9BACT|nr:MAG: hypothetical protein A3F32_02970 [Candidatus Roizmanbacteria bacterium RIFCSPHIGHO2_12_FULL_42_10]OGK61335.1 MAG: hypothetical protein A3I56_01820 [Candidatus Roizmanbacteria bacterium RIFCSPLOWO2_02_FULL_43_10]